MVFLLKKVFENFRIALTGMSIDIIYTAKLKKFRYLDVVNTILTKITNIAMLPTNIKTFFQNCIGPNTCQENMICIL